MSEEPQVQDAMEETDEASLAALSAQASAPASASAGAMLRQLRESAGVELAAIATFLKVTPRTLRLLEEDRYDALPDIAFARGLASSICRNFGVDPAPVLAQMPRALPGELSTENAVNAPFYSPADRPGAMLPKYISRPLTVIVGLFLLGSLLLWLWPTLPVQLGETEPDAASIVLQDPSVADAQNGLTAAPAQAAPEDAASTTGSAPSSASTDTAAQGDASDNSAANGTEQDDAAIATLNDTAADAAATDEDTGTAPSDGANLTADATAAADTDAATPDTTPPSALAAATEDEPAEEAVGASDDLVIEAVSDESWLSVRDASGQSLYNGLLGKGETARISGELPLSATIGRKGAVTVLVHGQPFDHRSLGSGSVSRFKVE